MLQYKPHYTVADYQQWRGDWELWQGTAIAMTPSPFGRHQHITARLLVDLTNQLDAQSTSLVVLSEIDWIIANDTVVRPDIVVCDGVPDRYLETAPLFIAEILSPSTQQNDRTTKFELYRSEGVRYYFLLDPHLPNGQAELYKLADNDFERIDANQAVQLGAAELHLNIDKLTSN